MCINLRISLRIEFKALNVHLSSLSLCPFMFKEICTQCRIY